MQITQLALALATPLLVLSAPLDIRSNSLEVADAIGSVKPATTANVARSDVDDTPVKRGSFWDWWNEADIRDGLPSTLGPCEGFEQAMGRDCDDYNYGYDRPDDP